MAAKNESQWLLNNDVWWSVERAALHLGCPKKTIQRYIREGLPLYGTDIVNRDELLAEFRKRKQRQMESRVTRRNQ